MEQSSGQNNEFTNLGCINKWMYHNAFVCDSSNSMVFEDGVIVG